MPGRCKACGHVALEVTGQFELLDSYFLEPGGPPPSSAGNWHTKCLRESEFGAAWYAARLRNFVEVRGYVSISQSATWTVLSRHGCGIRIALSVHGSLVTLPSASEVTKGGAGVHYREFSPEYNLHLPDAELIKAMQDALVRDGECPMSMMFDRLGLWPFLDNPEVLQDARFIYDQDLCEHWGAESLCAASEYNVLVPAELVQFCV